MNFVHLPGHYLQSPQVHYGYQAGALPRFSEQKTKVQKMNTQPQIQMEGRCHLPSHHSHPKLCDSSVSPPGFQEAFLTHTHPKLHG